jgi:hypothetical protein
MANFGVFISYRSTRMGCAARLSEYLADETGLLTWVDWERIGNRKDWRTIVAKCLPSMDLLLAVGAQEYRRSPYCAFEWTYAQYAKLPCLRLEDCLAALPGSREALELGNIEAGMRDGVLRVLRRYALAATSASCPCCGC